jgi:hypothetical protein
MTAMSSGLLLSPPVGMPVKTLVVSDVRHVLRCFVGWTMIRVLTYILSPILIYHPHPLSFLSFLFAGVKTTTLTEGGSSEMATLPSPPAPPLLLRTVPTEARAHYCYAHHKNMDRVLCCDVMGWVCSPHRHTSNIECSYGYTWKRGAVSTELG